jgi:hypothetical protein
LAAYLLEPESDDGLAAWNFFDPDLQPESEYPVLRVHMELAGSKLAPVDDVPPGERLTLEHIMQPGHTIEFSTTGGGGANWLGNELIVRHDGHWRIIDPQTGAARPSEAMEKMERAFAKLEAFKTDEARERLTPSMLTSDGKYGLLSYK